MKRRGLILILLLQLTGCVRMGSGDYLVTPVGFVSMHSFSPHAAPIGGEKIDVAAALREAARGDSTAPSLAASNAEAPSDAASISAVSSPATMRSLDGA